LANSQGFATKLAPLFGKKILFGFYELLPRYGCWSQDATAAKRRTPTNIKAI
jgi:hypothetical protein